MIDVHVARLTAPRRLEFVTESLSTDLTDDEILAETMKSAISVGTETAAFEGLAPLRPGPIYPRVVGYCNVARVIATGSEVRTLVPGDVVVTTQSHRSAFRCPEDSVLGRVPTGMDPGEAATTYLFHLGYSTLRNAGVSSGDHVAVVGLGVLGMGAVGCATLAGSRVSGFSAQPGVTELLHRFGGERVFDKSEPSVVDEYVDHISRAGADVVVLTSDRWDDYLLSLRLLRTRGTLAILGFPGRGLGPAPFNPLDSQYFYDKQLRIQSSNWSSEREASPARQSDIRRRNCEFLLHAIGTGRLPAACMLSGESPWSDLAQVYERLRVRTSGELSHLLHWTS